MIKFALNNDGYLLTERTEDLIDCFDYYYNGLLKLEQRVLKPRSIGKYQNKDDYKLLIGEIKRAAVKANKNATTTFFENMTYFMDELDVIERNLDLLKRSIDYQIRLENEAKENAERTAEYEAKVENDIETFILQALRNASTQDLRTQDALAIISQFRNEIGITNETKIVSKMASTFKSLTKKIHSAEMSNICKFEGCLYGDPVTETSTIAKNDNYEYIKVTKFTCERCGRVLPVVLAKCLAPEFVWDGDSKKDLVATKNMAVDEYSRSRKPIQINEKIGIK